MAKAGRGDDQYMLRFPEGLRERVKAAAEANGRSMNSEIIARIERTFIDEIFEDSDELKAARAARRAEPEDLSGFYKIPGIVSGEELGHMLRKALAETLEKAGVVRERVEVNIKDDKDGK